MAQRIVIKYDKVWFNRLATRLRFASTHRKVTKVMQVAINRTLDEAVEVAHHYLDVFIYSAPLPPSAFGREAWYERTRRRGVLYDAVQKRQYTEGALSGTVYVDEAPLVANRESHGYFYALTVEFGATTMAYWARPFWRAMAATMRIKYLHNMELAALDFVSVEMRRD